MALKQNWQRFGLSLKKSFSLRRAIAAYRSLAPKERLWFSGALIILIIGISGGLVAVYLYGTAPAPTYGGTITEGVVGKPFAVHPFVASNSPADSILEELIFSSLLKPDGNGGLLPDLAERYDVLEGGKIYVVSLRDNLEWHDHYPLTADDVLFTLQLIKNQGANHPLYDLFRDVEVEVLTARTLKFTLTKTFSFFPQYLTFKIIPKHIWNNVPVQNFAFSEYSLKPIGSGPYVFKKIVSTKEGIPLQYLLSAAPTYYLAGPYIQTYSLRFFSSPDETISALRKKEIDSFAGLSADAPLNGTSRNFRVINPVIPQSFGLFFNLDVSLLQDKAMRQAIQAALPIESFFSDELINEATRIDSPVWFIAPAPYPFSTTTSETLLASLGWKDSDNDGIKDKKLLKKDKTPTPLELSLTMQDSPEMQTLGLRLQEELKGVGISIILKPADINEFHNRLRSRSFQLLLVGELPTSGYYPDLFSFFHSSQKPPQGKNFSGYENKSVDADLLALRSSSKTEVYPKYYQEIVDALRQDVPAIFIYRPNWSWLLQKNIQTPPLQFLNTDNERLSRVNEWYIFTKRAWK